MRIAFSLAISLRGIAAIGMVMSAAAQTFTEFSIPSGGTPAGITTGPDGALWFTEVDNSKIGRITIGGDITEFPTITLNSRPFSITTGPDGALWFTDHGFSKIGRISTTATAKDPQLTEFTVSLGQLFGITAGLDGTLWFTASAGQVGRITTTGVLTNVFQTSPIAQGITTGPDGALWIATLDSIDKMKTEGPAGQITRFRIPTARSHPWGIASGLDGDFWFTERDAGKIGRLTNDGKIAEFVVPNKGLPSGITMGPNSEMWFTVSCVGNPQFPVPRAKQSAGSRRTA